MDIDPPAVTQPTQPYTQQTQVQSQASQEALAAAQATENERNYLHVAVPAAPRKASAYKRCRNTKRSLDVLRWQAFRRFSNMANRREHVAFLKGLNALQNDLSASVHSGTGIPPHLAKMLENYLLSIRQVMENSILTSYKDGFTELDYEEISNLVDSSEASDESDLDEVAETPRKKLRVNKGDEQ